MPDGDDGDNGDDGDLAAGEFSIWLREMQAARRGERPADVPCDGCTACCTASQFVHIAPDEADALARIPAALLVAAPRMPRGHMVLGYDEWGRCPMLVDDRCSIYEHRPRACREYDCRIFPAAGIEPDGEAKGGVRRRARRWRFTYPSPADRAARDAVRTAASYLREHSDVLPDIPASDATQVAPLAVWIHDLFLASDGCQPTVAAPEPEAVRVELVRRMARRD
jgi:uncharacterized protein